MNKIIPSLFFFIILISFASASLGSVAQGECMNIRVLANCSAVNISEVSNNHETFTLNAIMSNLGGQTFNYSFCNTSRIGTYSFSWDNPCVDCGSDGCGNSFEVTYDGNILNIESSILYLGLISILILLFLLVVFLIPYLPSGNNQSSNGMIMSINNLKYLKPVLLACAWGLLLGIVFIISNISIAYLPTAMFGAFFFMLFKIMFIFTLPMTVIWFVYIIAKLFQDREMKKLIERGVEVRGKP